MFLLSTAKHCILPICDDHINLLASKLYLVVALTSTLCLRINQLCIASQKCSALKDIPYSICSNDAVWSCFPGRELEANWLETKCDFSGIIGVCVMTGCNCIALHFGRSFCIHDQGLLELSLRSSPAVCPD